jgi:hypothetical protein
MRLLLHAVVIFVLSLVPAFAAQWEGVFEGTLGTSKILVELNAGFETSEYKGGYAEGGRYSYLPKTRDINLILDQADGSNLKFTETHWPHRRFADEDDKQITGRWVLVVSGETATGTWTSPDGKKTLPLALTRLSLASFTDARTDVSLLTAAYDQIWLSQVRFSDAGVAKRFGAVEVRYLKDSAFKTKYPVIGRFPDDGQKRAINDLLIAKHRAAVLEYRNCFNGVPYNWSDAETEPRFEFDVTYASPKLLSYTESGSVFCGGAHPNNYVSPKSFDLTTGTQMGGDDLDDLSPDAFGRVLKLANKTERIAFEAYVMKKWKAGAAKDKDQGEGCSEGWMNEAPDGATYFRLSFTKTGLAVMRTDYPHVSSVCLYTEFNPTVIPWTDLKPWLRPDQKLLTLD